jgi:FtsH-binding integral membrane protein
MKPRPRFLAGVLFLLSLILLACGVLACGSGNNHSLQSVSISPAAGTSPAQFSATGTYNTMPTSGDITATTTWCLALSPGVCGGELPTQAYVAGGVAQCTPGATGTFMVLAGQPSGPPPGINQGWTLKPFGTAQLTCP